MTELWGAVKPWLPWMVPMGGGALVIVFVCYMIWPDRTARAFGLLAITFDSFAKRFRRARGKPERAEPERPRRSTPAPPTISGFAIPKPDRRKDDEPPETD